MRRILVTLGVLAIAGLAVFWFVTRPVRLPPETVAGLKGDPAHGEQVFWGAGCSSCHAALTAEGNDKLLLGGGQKFPSPFGTFSAPNISPDPNNGIGKWSLDDFANAVMRGVAPDGSHLYPVLPYATYEHAKPQDIADLYAYVMTLPPVATPSEPQDVPFPFNIRRLLGGWKFLYMNTDWVVNGTLTPEQDRGRYLVEALAHCGECHTPRTALGGMDRSRWLSGAPVPGGQGNFPNITPAKLDWSEKDIVEYLTSGLTPDYDSAGGHMALVVENMAHLPETDRQAIAAYLKIVPPVQ